MSLPNAEERLSHGEPTWFIRGKRCFAMLADHHHDDRVAVWLAAPEGFQDTVTTAEPGRFFRPPYVGVNGWIGVYLDAEVDWNEMEELVRQSYRQVAPPKLRSMLD